jgi:hypothetical protein
MKISQLYSNVVTCSGVEIYRRFRRALMIEAVSTPKASVSLYEYSIWCNIPEDKVQF